MGLFWRLIALLIALLSCRGVVIAGEYYNQFLSLRGANVLGGFRITASGLVDTNNASLKLTNFVKALTEARGHRELASIRLGMSMEEVVAAFGKPMHLHSWCFGGPRLAYKDVSVIFDSSKNAVMKVRIDTFYHSDDAPSSTLTLSDCIGIFGKPTSGGDRELIYDGPGERLRLRFFEGVLFWAQLEIPATSG